MGGIILSAVAHLRDGDPVAWTVATFVLFWALNILYVYLTAPSAEQARRRMLFVRHSHIRHRFTLPTAPTFGVALSSSSLSWLQVLLLHPRDVVVVIARLWIMVETTRTTAAFWVLLWPLYVFEAISIQLVADIYEGRPLMGPTWHVWRKHIPVAMAETLALNIGFLIWGGRAGIPMGPTQATWMLHMLWRAALFDIGLDFGFYTFHRTCHANRTLYKWIHAPHHADTGKRHGHLVAHETYDLTLNELNVLLYSYLIGFELLRAFSGSFNLLDVATLVSWGHYVELLCAAQEHPATNSLLSHKHALLSYASTPFSNANGSFLQPPA